MGALANISYLKWGTESGTSVASLDVLDIVGVINHFDFVAAAIMVVVIIIEAVVVATFVSRGKGGLLLLHQLPPRRIQSSTTVKTSRVTDYGIKLIHVQWDVMGDVIAAIAVVFDGVDNVIGSVGGGGGGTL